MSAKFRFPWQKKQDESPVTNAAEVESTDLDTGEVTTSRAHKVQGERHLPSVNKGASVKGRMMNYLTGGLVLLLIVFVLWRYYAIILQKRADREATKGVDTTKQAGVTVPPLHKPFEDSAFNVAPPDEPPPEPKGDSKKDSGNGNTGNAGGDRQGGANNNSSRQNYGTGQQGYPNGSGNYGQEKPLTPEQEAEARKKDAPVLFNVGTGNVGVGSPGVPTVRSPSGGGDEGMATMSRRDSLAEALKPTYTPGVKASMLPDRDLFITKGTFLDCVMEPAIDTKVQGFISCVLDRDVRGASGNVVLLEKGTKLTGEYHGEVKGNDARIFILWALAETPLGVVVELDSPTTDQLGRAGVGGYVDTHFKERFSAALLVSAIQDTVDAVTGKNKQGGSTTVVLPNTVQGTQSMAVEVLKQDSVIANTLTKAQGEHVMVYVARHIDFRGVYRLERK